MATAEQNPLLEGLALSREPDPSAPVIYGASGDLTKRKLIPPLYSLASRRLVPESFAVVAVARTPESTEDFRARMKEAVQEFGRDELREEAWERLASGMRYVSTDFASEQGDDLLANTLAELDE